MGFSDTLIVFSTRFLGVFIEAVPFLLLGTLVSGLIEAFLDPADLLRVVPRQPVLAALLGGLLGFAFPVCECGVVPVTRRLYRKGLPVPVGIAFLLASPVVNPIVIASTYTAFHQRAPDMVLLRVGVALIVAVLIGLIFSFERQPERLLRAPDPASPITLALHLDGVGGGPQKAPADSGKSPDKPLPESLPTQWRGTSHLPPFLRHAGEGPGIGAVSRPSLWAGLRQALDVAGGEFFDMGRYLIVGALLAASVRVFVSQGALEALATNPVNSVLVMQVLAFVLSICSTADAFVALDFSSTFTHGAVLGFLTFGPMVDIKSTIMFLGVFRRRVVVYLILLPFLFTTLVAVWANLNLRF
jgi:uncharacterized protein